jgi:hypothetical protein
MASSLATLLDRVNGARGVLPYLAALETALQQQGLTPLETMSTQTLSRICAQLASLTVADDDLPLQDLQSLLLRALKRRSVPTGDGAGALSTTSQSFDGGAVMVTEISHSAFMAATAGHADTVPMALAVPPHPAAQPK